MNKQIKFWLVFGIAAFFPLNFPAFAETKLVDVNLKIDENQSFKNSLQQAESMAINLINQEFERSTKVTEVGITIIGERNGQEVPILSTKVSRIDWQARPTIQSWTKYFTKAEILLGFNLPQKTKPQLPKSSPNLSSKQSDPGFRDD